MAVSKLVKSVCQSERTVSVQCCVPLFRPALQGAVHSPGAMHTRITFLGKPCQKRSPCRNTYLSSPHLSSKTMDTAVRSCSWQRLPAHHPAQTLCPHRAGQLRSLRQFSRAVVLSVGLYLSFGLGARKQKCLHERRQNSPSRPSLGQ